MATIRAFTTIEQSRKLAEILSIESADMYYHYDYDFDELEFIPTITEEDDHFVLFPKDIRCWSFAALINILPKEIEIEAQRYTPCLFPIKNKWLLKLWYNSNYTITSPIAIFSDNPVDACYEMIIKLNELKML